MKETVSLNEKEFILEALHSRARIDGRGLYDFRAVTFTFGKTRGTVEVELGATRVYCCVTAEDKPTEGIYYFDINFSPIADPGFEGGRPPEHATEIARIIEKGLKESKAIDSEELCIVAGTQVWSIRVNLTVLDNDGNLGDAAGLAAIAALLDFRRPDVTVVGDAVTIEHIFVVDPLAQEEAVTRGLLTVMVNDFSEVCLVEKPGGIGIGIDVILNCAQLAATKASELIAFLKESLAIARPPPPPLKVKRVGQKEASNASERMDLDRPVG